MEKSVGIKNILYLGFFLFQIVLLPFSFTFDEKMNFHHSITRAFRMKFFFCKIVIFSIIHFALILVTIFFPIFHLILCNLSNYTLSCVNIIIIIYNYFYLIAVRNNCFNLKKKKLFMHVNVPCFVILL